MYDSTFNDRRFIEKTQFPHIFIVNLPYKFPITIKTQINLLLNLVLALVLLCNSIFLFILQAILSWKKICWHDIDRNSIANEDSKRRFTKTIDTLLKYRYFMRNL